MKIKLSILTAVFLSLACTTQARVLLPSVLSSNMVLQQQSKVLLWGKARPSARLSVKTSWDNKTQKTTVAADSTWQVEVNTPAAGGPYSITFNDGEELRLDNVMSGEVWFCTGQSNMEMPMRGFDRQPLRGGNDVIARAKASTPIRMFLVDSKNGRWVRNYAKTPQTDIKGEWLVNSPENVASCSATAYYFARYLQDVLDVPVGIIVSTRGGARIEAWMSRETLAPFKGVDFSVLDSDKPVTNDTSTPCVLYNAKICPFFKYAVKGFLWYQGESNRDNANQYAAMQTAFVKDLRAKWGRGDLPFYYVQIAPYDYDNPDATDAARLREAQAACLKTIPNCGMVPTLDIGNHNFIHPVNKETVGQRLAWWALGQTYGMKGFGYAPPVYKSMEVKDGKIYINVENGGNGLCPMWTSLKGFEIAGADKVFHPAFAEIETKTCRLAVSSPQVPEPVAVRYAFHNTSEASTFNIAGLPLVPFRTDNWDK